MKAIILAGGKGARLRPYTLVLPKPLMPVGGQPVIEILLKWLRRNEVADIYITLGYLGHLIKALCGDGKAWDLHIQYSEEKEALGTVGPLSLLGRDILSETFVLVNGDLITDLNLRGFITFHKEQKSIISIAVANKKVKVDLGVLEFEKNRVTSFKEKPTMNFHVSMGIYCMEPEILDFIPRYVPFGFDDLMHTLIAHDQTVSVYQHDGIWIDIGRAEDFERAQEMVEKNEFRLLGI